MSVMELLREMAFQKHCEELSVDGIVEGGGEAGDRMRHFFFMENEEKHHWWQFFKGRKAKLQEGELWNPTAQNGRIPTTESEVRSNGIPD